MLCHPKKVGSQSLWMANDSSQTRKAVRVNVSPTLLGSQRLSTNEFWDQPLPPEIQPPPTEPLDQSQIGTLWSMLNAIPIHWELEIEVELLRSRWLDMLEARGSGVPSVENNSGNCRSMIATPGAAA